MGQATTEVAPRPVVLVPPPNEICFKTLCLRAGGTKISAQMDWRFDDTARRAIAVQAGMWAIILNATDRETVKALEYLMSISPDKTTIIYHPALKRFVPWEDSDA